MIFIHDTLVSRRLAVYLDTVETDCQSSLDYLAEGAANVIFSIRSTTPQSNQGNGGFVLRMRKDLPFTTPTIKALHEFDTRIAPLFVSAPSLLLPPVKLELSSEVVRVLNLELHRLEDEELRPPSRQHVYLPTFAQEQHALILPNLRHGPGEVIEFKPKWLVQSPSAPSEAQHCRTCALNAMRRQKTDIRGRGDSGLCPLDLLSSSKQVLMHALAPLWKDTRSLPLFATSFQANVQPALRHLQDLQKRHNEVGLDDFTSEPGKDFSVAMALRDCSIFLKANKSSDPVAVDITLVKILDLDLKDAGGGKLAKWITTEQELIGGGWYIKTDDPSVRCAISAQGNLQNNG